MHLVNCHHNAARPSWDLGTLVQHFVGPVAPTIICHCDTGRNSLLIILFQVFDFCSGGTIYTLGQGCGDEGVEVAVEDG